MRPEKQHLLNVDDAPLILVVDDEVLIRILAVDLLHDAGFRVIEACDADEAIAILDSNVACDVIFTDVNMPGSMDGLDLAAYVQREHPSVAVVLTSGGVPYDVLIKASPGAIVTKPYSELDLTRAIDQALEGRHG